jgi:hypothetical protein
MIFIKGNVPSLKNSKVKGIFPSKSVMNYLKSLNIQQYSVSKKTVKGYKSPDKPNLFISQISDYFKDIKYPVIVGTHFVRNSKRRFDIINAQQILFDLLSSHHFIEDDNADCIIPVSFKINGNWVSYNKQCPGVFIKIFDTNTAYDVSIPELYKNPCMDFSSEIFGY